VAGGGQLGTSAGEKEEVACAEFAAAACCDGAFGDRENGEAIAGLIANRVAWSERELFDFEEFTLGDDNAACSVHAGLEVVEVDAFHGLFDVEFAGVAVESDAVPIEDAVGGVGVLLDFVDEKSGTNGVEPPGRNEDGLAFLRLNGMDDVGHATIGEGGFEALTSDAFFEARVEFRAGIGIGDEPHLGFGVASEGWGEMGGWVDLDGEVVAGIEDLDEERKALGWGQALTEDGLPLAGPKLVQGLSGEGTVHDDGLFIFAIADFP